MKVSVEMTGLNEALAAVQKLGDAGEDVVRDTIADVTLETHGRAVRGIQSGPASGRIYEKYKPRRTHQASAPGEYPMSDLGSFAQSVQFEFENGGMTAFVGTADERGPWFELGTSRMASRPWLEPSFREAVAGVTAELIKRLEART